MVIIKDICNFLKKFSHIIPEEEKNKLINIQSNIEYRNNLKKIKSRYGLHYEDCPWSDDNCKSGPDTCACSSVERMQDEANRIIQLYTNIYNLNRSENCNFH